MIVFVVNFGRVVVVSEGLSSRLQGIPILIFAFEYGLLYALGVQIVLGNLFCYHLSQNVPQYSISIGAHSVCSPHRMNNRKNRTEIPSGYIYIFFIS